MKKSLALIVFLLCVSLVFAEKPKETSRSEGNGPQFRCRVGQFLADSPDSVRLLVVVTVPYDNLQFVRKDSGFSATFELVCSVYDSQGALTGEQMTYPKLFTTSYEVTNLTSRLARHTDSFVVGPGEYRVQVVLTERESNGESRYEAKISIPPPNPLLRLSDVFWVADSTSGKDLGDFRVVEAFFSDDGSATARFQTASTGPESLRIAWEVRGPSKSDSLHQKHEFKEAPHLMPITHQLQVDLTGLTSGDYILSVEAEGNGQLLTRELPFMISLHGLPRSVMQLDEAIRELRPIATAEEMRQFQEAPPDKREELFREFWRRRDPTPGTEENELMDEYYYRVEYANEHFKTNRPGWETDRGRIYILYGEPSDIERHPFPIDSKPYEIWYYDHLNRRFIFVDYTGFGDYELVGPEWGP
jgi:GWxTD domain-containing protein